MGRAVIDMMLVVIVIFMIFMFIFVILNECLVLLCFGIKELVECFMDELEKSSKVIFVGFGYFGNMVGWFLWVFGVEFIVLDFDFNWVDFLWKMGFKVFYGDVSWMDLLELVGIVEVDIFIIIIGNLDVMVDFVR